MQTFNYLSINFGTLCFHSVLFLHRDVNAGLFAKSRRTVLGGPDLLFSTKRQLVTFLLRRDVLIDRFFNAYL